MKRPFALVGFSVLPALMAAVFLGEALCMAASCLLLLLFALSLFLPKWKCTGVFPIAFLSAALALGLFSGYSQTYLPPAAALDGKDVILTGTVTELPERRNGKFLTVVEVNEMSSAFPAGMKLCLFTQNSIQADPYSRIQGRVHLMLPTQDFRASYAADGVFLLAFLYEYEDYAILPPTEKPPYYYALMLRAKMRTAISELMPQQEAGLARAVLLGDKSKMPESLQVDFRKAGVTHIMAISGLHMAILLKLFLSVFAFLRIPKRVRLLFTALGILGFMAVTGFPVSVVRSGIMCFLYLGGQMVSRKPDALNSLGFAVFLICLGNPFAAADVSLLLSAGATLGIILTANPISGFLQSKIPFQRGRNAIRWFCSSLGMSVSAILFTLPVSLLYFGSFSWVAPFVNLIEIPLCTALLPCALFAAVIQVVLPQTGLAMLFGIPAGLLARWMEQTAHWFSTLPAALVPEWGRHGMLWLAACLLLLSLAVLLVRKPRSFGITVSLCLLLLLSNIFSWRVAVGDSVRLFVADVGTGISVVLNYQGHTAVVGCGGATASPVLQRISGNTTIDYLQLLTADRNECRNAAVLLSQYSVDAFIYSTDAVDGFLLRELSSVPEQKSYRQAAVASLWGKVTIRTANGLTQVTTNGISILLCPQDADLTQAPQEFLLNDFFIFSSVPSGLERCHNRYGILCMDEQDQMEASLQKIRFPLRSIGDGGLEIRVTGDREIECRR